MSAVEGLVAHPYAINVLIVDDLLENRIALRAILDNPKYTIVDADSGLEALRHLIDEEFAVLIVDIMMPDMNGLELARLIRARAKTASVPIVFTTAATDDSLVFDGYRAGAVDYLIKPLDADIVRAKIAVLVQLYSQRKLIEAQLHEKEILLKEIHHRVKNNLQVITSLLHLQAVALPAESRLLFEETEARVRSIALVHENLYAADSLAAIAIDPYMKTLVDRLVRTFGSTAKVHVVADGVRMAIESATAFGLIVNEIVTNAIKHAFPDEREGIVTVSLDEHPAGTLVLEVADNGVGFPAEVDFTRPVTMGLQLVRSLSAQLDGTLELDTKAGTLVRMTFPKPPA